MSDSGIAAQFTARNGVGQFLVAKMGQFLVAIDKIWEEVA
jgi:hypothetical protein